MDDFFIVIGPLVSAWCLALSFLFFVLGLWEAKWLLHWVLWRVRHRRGAASEELVRRAAADPAYAARRLTDQS